MAKQPIKTVNNCRDVFINAAGMVNTAEIGGRADAHGRTTAAIEMKVGERLLITRGEEYLKVELYPARDVER